MRNSIGAIEPKTPVVINLYDSGIIKNAQVEAFIVNDSTVWYDVSVKFAKPEWDQPIFTKLQRIHSSCVWEVAEYEDYCRSMANVRKFTTSELQAILYKMDAYKLDAGFIGVHTNGGHPDFYEHKPSFDMHTWQTITRKDVLRMIDES